MRPMLAALLLLALLPPRAARAQGDAYQAALREARVAVREARGSEGAAREEAVGRALEELSQAEEAPGAGRPYLSYIERALRASPPQLEKADDYLLDLLSALRAERTREPGEREERALQEVLRDPRFAPEPPPNWLERLGRRVWDWLTRLWPDTAPRTGSVPSREGLSVSEWLLVLLCAALVALAAVFVARGARRRGRREGEAAGHDAPLTPASALDVAAAHARRGEYRAAVRARFVALLLELHEGGRLRYSPSLTNREHLARIGLGTPLAEELRPVVRVFDDVWYGNVPLSTEEYALFERQVEAVRGEVPA